MLIQMLKKVLENFMQQQMLLIESQQEVMKKMNTIVDGKVSSIFIKTMVLLIIKLISIFISTKIVKML